MFKAADLIGGFYYMYYPYMALLCGLYCLHVYWFGIIVKILYYQFKLGHVCSSEALSVSFSLDLFNGAI